MACQLAIASREGGRLTLDSAFGLSSCVADMLTAELCTTVLYQIDKQNDMQELMW